MSDDSISLDIESIPYSKKTFENNDLNSNANRVVRCFIPEIGIEHFDTHIHIYMQINECTYLFRYIIYGMEEDTKLTLFYTCFHIW